MVEDEDINYYDVEVEVGKRSWMDIDGDDDGGDYYNGQDHGTQGQRAKEETKLLSSKVNPSGGPRGRRGACGSCNQ